MSIRIVIDCSQLSRTYYNVLFGSSTRVRHAQCIYRRTKITRKASDVGENLQLYKSCSVLPPKIVMHNAYIGVVQRITLNVSCMTTSGGRTEQLDIIAGFLPRHWLYE